MIIHFDSELWGRLERLNSATPLSFVVASCFVGVSTENTATFSPDRRRRLQEGRGVNNEIRVSSFFATKPKSVYSRGRLLANTLLPIKARGD